jgi:hypothetical protein
MQAGGGAVAACAPQKGAAQRPASRRPPRQKIERKSATTTYKRTQVLRPPGLGMRFWSSLVAQRARGNEINTATTLNMFLTCEVVVFWIVNQKYQKVPGKRVIDIQIKYLKAKAAFPCSQDQNHAWLPWVALI